MRSEEYVNRVPERRDRAVHATKQALGAIAVAALLRTMFYAAVDAFAFHLVGDPRPGRGVA